MKYIGSRYVPKFMGTYDDTQIYEALCVVDNGMGTSYISQKIVPAGTPLTDNTYWAIYGASSGAIINLQEQIDQLKDIFVTPQMFGAVGDGLTDDSAAFISMLSNHKNVFIPEGEYLISQQLDISSGTIIIGDEKSLIIDDLAIGTSVAFTSLFNISNADSITINGVNVKGSHESITAGSGQYKNIVNIYDSEHVTIENCKFLWSDALYVIKVKESDFVDIKDCYINHYNYIAMTLLITCGNCNIVRNTVLNCENYSYNSKGQCYAIDFSGFDAPLTSEPMNHDIVIDGNYVYQTHGTWEGIGGHGGDRVKIVNNTVLNTYSGICADSDSNLNFKSSNIIIANNYVKLTTENYIPNIVKHNECIVIGGENFDVHDNILINGGLAGSEISTFDDPTAIGIYGAKNIRFHDNLLQLNYGNIFKLKLDCSFIDIYNNELDFLYWATPYGALKPCAFNLHEATSLVNILIHDNILERFQNNDWLVFGKTGASTVYSSNAYVKVIDNKQMVLGRNLICYQADNIITDMSDISNVSMGKVGDMIVNPSASSGDPLLWMCSANWSFGAGGAWTPIYTMP